MSLKAIFAVYLVFAVIIGHIYVAVITKKQE